MARLANSRRSDGAARGDLGIWLVIAPILVVSANTIKMITNYQELEEENH